MPLTITTLDDENFNSGTEAAEAADGTGLSLREALALLGTGSTGPVGFDPGLINGAVTLASTLDVTTDVYLNGFVDYLLAGDGPVMNIQTDGITVTLFDGLLGLDANGTGYGDRRALNIEGDSITFNNEGAIEIDGDNIGDSDGSIGVAYYGNNFTFFNSDVAAVQSEGQYGIQASGLDPATGAAGFSANTVITNEGFISGTDDAVQINHGTINNFSEIIAAGTFTTPGFEPGETSDGVSVVATTDLDPAIDYSAGLGIINNSAAGLIEGIRSGVYLNGGGTVTNAGLIQGDMAGIAAQGHFGPSSMTVVDFSLVNSGTIERFGAVFGDFANRVASVTIEGSESLTTADITNSGTILSIDIGVRSSVGTVVVNTATGSIDADSFDSGSGTAFLGAQLEDFAIGGGLYDVPTGWSFDDNITNDGTIIGDIRTGLGDDIFVNNNAMTGNITLGEGNDTLTLGADATQGTIDAGNGDDFIFANNVANAITGGGGSDTVSYAGGATGVTVDLTAGTASGGDADGDSLTGIENLIGTTDADSLTGNTADNSLVGGRGGDTLLGLGGNDIIEGGGGLDVLDGGDGIDTLTYENSTNRIVVNMATNSYASGHATGDTVSNFENVVGTNFGDIITGTSGANAITGGNGFDILSGFSGDDVITGDAGNDFLTGGAGADTIDGGNGSDIARYVGSDAGVMIDLGAGTASGGHAEGDVLQNIELLFGSSFDDGLTGDSGNNWLFGADGNDTLSGGAGIDKMFGGAGADSFVFNAGDNFVFVTDFQDDLDRIDLSSYGYATVADALADMNDLGANTRFFNNGDTLYILGMSVSDIADDIDIA